MSSPTGMGALSFSTKSILKIVQWCPGAKNKWLARFHIWFGSHFERKIQGHPPPPSQFSKVSAIPVRLGNDINVGGLMRSRGLQYCT
jgi:hypothetical protein